MKPAVISDKLALNYNEQSGLKGIIRNLTRKYSFIDKIMLYGSKARGDFSEDSDIDLLFITKIPVSRSIKNEMNDIIYNYELKHDIIVSVIVIPESDFKNKISPFLIKVRREGVIIWLRK
ncbi:MAG: nucleotidyltransferase domain-containing protein [Nitrospirae bacterium]|nr:nucleotidyltransferase domain-containing protein [Nitrospirota bacterium]